MFLGGHHAPILERRAQRPQILDPYVCEQNIINNQILHDDQTTREETFYTVDHER